MRRAWIVLGLLAFAAGCGSATRVEGTVTLDDRPLDEGSVSFEPADGAGPSFGAAIKDGAFRVQGATPGKKRVRIRGSMKTGKKIPAGPPLPAGTMVDEVRQYPPPGAPEEVREVELLAGQANGLTFELSAKKKGG